MPKVSAVMVFHRVTPFFEPAVRSVLDQTERDLELVLVDNGSGQGLAPLGATGRDSRIRLLVWPENRGIAQGINHAVAHARAEIVALLDYDDLALPTRFEKQGSFLRAHPEVGMVSSRVETIDAEGRVVGREFSLLEPGAQQVYTQYAPPVVTPAYSGRRTVFQRHPYRPEFRLCGDFDALARMAETGPMAGIPEVLLHYRHYPGQASAAGEPLRLVETCLVRLLTARRRAGRDEGRDHLLPELRPWLDAPPAPPVLFAEFARRFLAEGFAAQAVYHARKLVAAQRDLAACVRAAGLVVRALRAKPRQYGFLARLFFTGPVRAHGLKPV